MRRRTFLQGTAGALALSGLVGSGAADEHGGSFEPLGSVDIEGAKDAAVHHDGTVAYVAAGDGFVSVDISDGSSPQVLAERRDIETDDGSRFGDAWDLWPWQDRLVVVGPSTVDPQLRRGFALFDISDPTDPQQVAFHSVEQDEESQPRLHVHNSYFVDETVYLTGSGLDPQPLIIVDVGGDDPEEVGRWDLTEHEPAWADVSQFSRILHDVYVQDEIAYLSYWDAGTWLVDVSNPGEPEVRSIAGGYTPGELLELDGERGRFESLIPPGNHHYAQVDEAGEVLVVGVEAWAADTEEGSLGGPGGVHLYDVSDKTDPEELATIDAPESFDQTREGWFTTAHNADIVDGRLYTSWYFGGVKVHDVSDPADPEELAWWRNPHEAAFWTAQSAVPGETFVGTSTGDIGAELGVDASLHQTRDALYVFPDRPGTQQDPPDLTTPPDDMGEDNGNDNGTTDGENADDGEIDDDTGDDGTENETVADGGGTDDGNTTNADDDGPGFGAGTTLAGVGGIGYLLARRLEGENES